MRRPTQKVEIVLFCVTGMSPAIITETVWALAHEKPTVVPDRVIAVTTTAGRLAIQRGIHAEVCLLGGAEMILAFQSRQTTKDIDAIFAPTAVVRELARQIGEEKGYSAVGSTMASKGLFPRAASSHRPTCPTFRI